MRWIDSCNHDIFAICLRETHLFLNDGEWLNKRSLFLRGTTRNSNLLVTKSTMDQFPLYLGVLNTPTILSFMLLLARDTSEPGHPN